MYEIKEKVAIVTGGAAGIGAGVVKAFLEEGAKHVAFFDINTDAGEKLQEELVSQFGAEKIMFHKCDVTTDDLSVEFDNVVKQFGYVDIVVNAAGILNDSPNFFVKCIQINVIAVITSSFKAYELMRKDRGGKGGTIINLSSNAAFVNTPMFPVYGASKAAVLKFSRDLGMASTFSRTGVRVLTMCFGMTDTGMVALTAAHSFDTEMKDLMNQVAQIDKQPVSAAVFGVVEAYKKGSSASTWMVNQGCPPVDITKDIIQGQILSSRAINVPNFLQKDNL